MKTKVLLVDDEKLERILISRGYDWEANGFEIVGEASCGEEALEFFDRKEPDIVFTDINMPYMDGLALTEKIKERSEKCRVVIVTGYREFEYARRAIKLGVKDFILKPVNINDIAALAKNIKDELKQEEGHNQEYNKLKEVAFQNQDILIESFLQRLVENRIEEEEALHKLKMYSFDRMLENSVCINIKPHLKSEYTDEKALLKSKAILKCISNSLPESTVSFVHYLCNVILYFCKDDAEQAHTFAEKLKEQINSEMDTEINIGISRMQYGFEGISKAYRQTEKAISASVILGCNSCITYEEYEEIKKTGQGSVDINWQDFVFNVENCFENKVEEYILEYTEMIKKAGVTDSGYLKLMTMNLLSKASEVLTKHGQSLGQLIGEENLYEEIARIETVTEMFECLKKMLGSILQFSDSTRTKKSNKIIDQALDYINTHLFEQELTLKAVAEKVFVNESYLSRIFKLETGEGLIEYITKRRIDQSIALLNTTDLKVYEIAEQVGFSDPHYFSICFKKTVGVTIKEYKKPKYQ